MLIYLGAAYSNVVDKDKFMRDFMKFSAKYMMANKGHFIVSPLFNHFSFNEVPEMGTDWEFWEEYSKELLIKCERLLIIKTTGWEQSVGVQGEIKFAEENFISVEYIEESVYNNIFM